VSRRAILEAASGIAFLSVMDGMIKGVAARYPTFELVFLRYLFGSLAILSLAALARPGWPSRETLKANGVRALLVVVTATSFFYALGALPLAETLALSFLSPIFVALFAAALLRETIDARIVAGLGLGLVGMAIIVWGKSGGAFGGSISGVMAVLLSALTYALSIVMLRARAQRDAIINIVAIQNAGPCLFVAGPAAWVWVAPTPVDWAVIASIGLLGAAGHLMLARAYSRAEAARLAPLEYTALIWAIILGLAFYGEIPTAATLGGAALIMAGTLISARR
jgi:drug/metabolite transporter (DMT)-like permease